MERHYDIVVVGSGSGLKIAAHAAKNGYSVALIDKGPFGGTCVNRGCIPSKMVIYPADVIHLLARRNELHISADNIHPEYEKIIERSASHAEEAAVKIQSKYAGMEHIDVYTEKATFLADRKIQVGDAVLTGDRFYLPLGSEPMIPDIPGLDQTPYLTSTQALTLKEQPKSLCVLGGGFIAAELAHFFATMGTEVTVLCRSRFLKHVDSEVRKIIQEQAQQHYKIEEDCKLKNIGYEKNQFVITGESREWKSKAVLIAVGRVPPTNDLGLENTSIQVDKHGYIIVDGQLRTAESKTWAWGDCIGRYLFRHMANFEANYLIKHFDSKSAPPITYPAIPFAVFTHPQIAVVGLTEEALREKGHDLIIGIGEYTDSGMGVARALTHGIVKLIFDQTSRKLLAAHIIGDEASTMIHMLIAFIHMQATLDDMIVCVYIHPALSEVINMAARNAANL